VTDQSRLRNFCIIAHIDHGKSTLADRLLEATHSLSERERKNQFLDKMDLERERGITIKAQTARMRYQARNGKAYVLNLIDTPGHVDFSYEVSRALHACEGALLVVDASQGIEAQTLANAYLAMEAGLEIIPVINKIDLPVADPEQVAREIEEVIGVDAKDALLVSAKHGTGIEALLERIVERIRPPSGNVGAPTRALVFDAWFDPYLGVALLVRVVEGRLHSGARIRLMALRTEHEIQELDVIDPHPRRVEKLEAGEVGVVLAGIKTLSEVRIGDTITETQRPAEESLPGFRDVKPMVFAGLYPVDSDDYVALKTALEKLRLNDASFVYEPETSAALGFGFRCGFLGFLHAEIVQERLEREYGLFLVTTSPTVRYRVVLTNGEVQEIESPASLPEPHRMERIEEPMILATLHLPAAYLGPVLSLCQERRGMQRNMAVHGARVQVRYELPLAEVVVDFHDRLKSATRGYGSLDYDLAGYRVADLVKLDVLVNGQPVDALSLIVHRDKAFARGSVLARRLRDFIPRQMFDVAIQAAVGSRVIARTCART
jgi:GTP-binding protein LepA